MSIPSIAISLHNSVPLLEGQHNWPAFKRSMTMFFSGAKVTHVITGSPPAEDDAKYSDWQSLDEQLSAFIFAKLDQELWYLVQDDDDESTPSGRAFWARLKAHFEKSTIGCRVQARRHLYHDITHDPSKPVGVFIHEVVTAAQKLKSMGCTVEDKEITDIILMGLDSSYDHVRTTLLVLDKELKLEDVKKHLASAASVVPPSTSHGALAASSKPRSYPRSSSYGPASSTSHSPSPIDSKGFRWCNPSNEGHCHRCGRAGHIAARCIFDMPQEVKDWVMTTSSRNRHPEIQKANSAFHFLSSPVGSPSGSPSPSPPPSPRHHSVHFADTYSHGYGHSGIPRLI
ncbi:hypothetical protein NP233_g10907 [Leucocoprinus birnbaumii]|uniref:CCHC-type domain-containing protein n=1 Tax=Leucocoprinus birnbaumii TaxID=56174 RepID=A0AAD5VNE9_9AGAR|nr:hypothetical protein NP233_g10907 [Leucocoprinus birnbaumii]